MEVNDDLEGKVLAILARYSSLDFESLKDLVLTGVYSFEAEERLKRAVHALTERGAVKAGGTFGPFWLPEVKTPARRGSKAFRVSRQAASAPTIGR